MFSESIQLDTTAEKQLFRYSHNTITEVMSWKITVILNVNAESGVKPFNMRTTFEALIRKVSEKRIRYATFE